MTMNGVKFTFEFTIQELEIIMKGLEELPFKFSNGIHKNIIDEYQKQAQAAAKKVKEE